MRDKNRIAEILKELERVWNMNPDLRLGQLLVAAVKPSESCSEVFHIEDDKILKGIQSLGEILTLNKS